jgi:murein DD-endopeptidase MepM/ murein hydrolase activator NlpD
VVVRTSSVQSPPKVFASAPRTAAPRAVSGIRPWVFYLSFAVLFGTNVLTMVGFLMAPDVAALFGGQKELVVAAYEDRIAQLRVEVDRLHSRQFAQAGDINLQLQELTQQQEVLLEQHHLVQQLAQKAAELGIETASLPAVDNDLAPTFPVLAADAGDLATISASMTQMMDDSRLALAGLSESATRSADEILGELGELGIRPALPDGLDQAVGGPLLPPMGDDQPGMVDDANAAYLALARFKAARSAIDLAPVHRPMDGLARTSSNFGNRKDPFTGGRAFHAGIDFPAPRGTPVLSAGYGKVTFVGEKAGYGKTVEITHAPGLMTRYGHLSAWLVKQGQLVSTGTPIAKVGSTGRSTGPHLHFEVRRKDVAVDPSRYLSVGHRLARYLGA